MKNKKELKEKAKEIFKLEQESKNLTSLKEESELEIKMMKIISSCSVEELVEIDEYVQSLIKNNN